MSFSLSVTPRYLIAMQSLPPVEAPRGLQASRITRMNLHARPVKLSPQSPSDRFRARESAVELRLRAEQKRRLRAQFEAWLRSHPEPSFSASYEAELVVLLIQAEGMRSQMESSK